MAGKKGMKHARPKTQEERDVYALTKIEQYIDTQVLSCEQCKADMHLKDLAGPVATLLKARYDKLRATKTESVVTHKSSFIDALKRIEDADRNIPQPQSTDSPRVTH